MVDPRVADLVMEFLHRQVFDNDLDAWRAAKRVVAELDQIAFENMRSGVVDPAAAYFAGRDPRESGDVGQIRRPGTPGSGSASGVGRKAVQP